MVFLANQLAGIVLWWLGFTKYPSSEESSGSSFGLDITNGRLSPGKHLTYWHAPAKRINSFTSSSLHPIVFFHGIGCGLSAYVRFIYKLRKKNLNRPIILVELPFVSMRLVESVPKMHHVVSEISQLLKIHGYFKACFVGHSLGSVYCTWMVRQRSDLISSVVLMDPICFELHKSHLVRLFFGW